MKRLYVFFLLILCLICTSIAPGVSAAETSETLFRAEISSAPQKHGDTVTVTLSPNRDIAACVVSIGYDPDAVTQVQADLTGTDKKDFLTFSDEGGTASLVYTAVKTVMEKTDGIVLKFKTNSKNAASNLEFKIEISDAADSSAKALLTKPESHTVSVAFPPAPSSDSTLVSLTPPTGTLTPEFSSDVYEYELEVPFAYTVLTFDAVPTEGASVKVNRKNLSSGGSTVDFDFTVTAADGSTKTVYTVAVTRLEKETAADVTDENDKTTTEKTENKSDKKTQTTTTKTEKTEATETITTTTTDDAAEPAPGVSATLTTGTAEEPVTYVYTENRTNVWLDRLVTAVIVLVSVCAGAGMTLLLQSRKAKIAKKEDKPE